LLAEALIHEPLRGGESLSESLRDRGVLLDADVDLDSIRFFIQAPADRLRWAVRQLRRALTRPPVGIDKSRSLALDELARRTVDPERRLTTAAWAAAYGSAHPYGRPVRGTADSLNAIKAPDLRGFHERHFRPDRMILAVAGDVEAATLRRELGRLKPPRVENLPSATQDPPPGPGKAGGPRILLLDRPGSNRAVIGVAAGLTVSLDPLDPAALVTNHLLGGPGYSRLLGALRNELGYAYDARSSVEFGRQGGLLLARSAVGAENAVPALRRLLAEIEALHREPPAEEVRRARTSLGNLLLAGWFETNRSTARAWARLALLGLDPEALDGRLRGIASVGGDDTARFAREQLRPERLVLLVVGDAARLAEPLGELGLGPAEVWSKEPSRRMVGDGPPAEGR
jgi:zinc protease